MNEESWTLLKSAAHAARQRAYAPYSGFSVGAALMTGSGEVFGGCNVENASLGLTICAERVAASSAIAAGYSDFSAMVISIPGAGTPCGACRQFLAEFNPQLLLRVYDTTEKVAARDFLLANLLPEAFDLKAD